VPQQDPAYKLVFSDDFNTLDLSPDGLGIHAWYEGVWFNKKHAPLANISASSSVLSLVWKSNQGSADTSITTLSQDFQNLHGWRYGYFEARVKWNPVTGAWPAIWLIPVQDATGQSIYSGVRESGEIDIFEGQGDHPDTFFGTIHDWVNFGDNASKNNAFQLPAGTDFSQFHIYGMLWSPGTVTWYFDNQPLHSENTAAIFDKQDFFLVLSMQEGANWTSGNLSGVTSSDMTLNVDWVRVWQKSSPAPPTNLGIREK
jgi:beta-glucanase (GH16 family)